MKRYPAGSGLAAAISALVGVAGSPPANLLGLIADHLGGIAFEMDNEGRVVRAVGTLRQTLDARRGQNAGRLVSEIFGDIPDLLAAVRRALGGDCVEVTLDIDGVGYDVEYAPLFGGDGTVTRVVGFASLRDAPGDAPSGGRAAA